MIRIKDNLYQHFDENGKEYLIGASTEQLAIEKYNAIKFREANPPPPTVQELREKEYLSQGITEKEMVVALWERFVENRPEASNLIQQKREIVKLKIPKG